MDGSGDRPREFVKDVEAGLGDAALQEKYHLSSKKLFLYKAAARDILDRRPTVPKKRVRKIDARQFLNDVNSGIGDDALMAKYDLAPRQLRKLMGQMVGSGLTTVYELSLRDRAVATPVPEIVAPVPEPKPFLGPVRWKGFALGFALLMLVVGALLVTNRSVTPKEATFAEAQAQAKAAGYRLIDTERLKEIYEKPSQDLLLVDTRQDWEYEQGHMRGALNFSMEPTWWSRWRKQGPLEAMLGPDKNRLIVFY